MEEGDLPGLQEIRRAAFAPVFSSFREIVGPEIADVAFASADAEQAKLLDDVCAEESKHHVLVAKVATVGVGGDRSHEAARRAYAKAGFGPAIPSLYLYRLL